MVRAYNRSTREIGPGGYEVRDILDYIVSLRPAWTATSEQTIKKKKKRKTEGSNNSLELECAHGSEPIELSLVITTHTTLWTDL